MNRSVKRWCRTAALLVALGLIICAAAVLAGNGDFYKFSTVNYETNTYEVDEAFESISIHVDTTDITFALADGDACSIVCYETEELRHSTAVENGVLMIRTVDTRSWTDHISLSFDAPRMTVCLPNDSYADVSIETDSGDILIPEDFAFGTLRIEGDTADIDCLAHTMEVVQIANDTGDIRLEGATADEISLASDTGDITLEGVTADKANIVTDTGDIELDSLAVNNGLEIATDTGKIRLKDVACADMQATSNTGNVHLENVVASGSFSINNDTGDVVLDNSDAQELLIVTESGDVKGSLRTEKVFITETDTGRINVPRTTTGGICEVITDTGDVSLTIGK